MTETLMEDGRDLDGDCLDTRQEVLLNSTEKRNVEIKNCKVVKGVWHVKYTDRFIRNPRSIQIDHIVPVKEADISGASEWTKEQKSIFYNDEKNLIAVSSHANQKKGSKDVYRWLPGIHFRCEYLRIWTQIKRKYNLKIDDNERNAIQNLLRECSLR